jgi:phosphate starvation-inducible membrane PsiE
MNKVSKRLISAAHHTETITESLGNTLVYWFHLLALFAIGASIVWSAFFTFLAMTEQGHAKVEDILLLFIYLELGAMVGIYFKTNHMPVRFLIYIAMTALTRMLIGFINVEHQPGQGILIVSGAILMLAFAVLVLRFGSHRYPSVSAINTQAPNEEAETA